MYRVDNSSKTFLEFLREATRVNRRGCRKDCSLIIYG